MPIGIDNVRPHLQDVTFFSIIFFKKKNLISNSIMIFIYLI